MDNTPFDIIGSKEKGYFAALGKYRITVVMPTPQHVEEYINSNMYNVVLMILQILIPGEVKHQLKDHLNPDEPELTEEEKANINGMVKKALNK